MKISKLVYNAIISPQSIPTQLLNCYINCYCQYNDCSEILLELFKEINEINVYIKYYRILMEIQKKENKQ